MKKEKYQKKLNSKCNTLTRPEKDRIFIYDTVSSFLWIASVVVLAGYCWLNYALFTSWAKTLFLILTCVFFALAIFLVFWRFARQDEKRAKIRLKHSTKIESNKMVNKIYNNLTDKEKEYYKKKSLTTSNEITVFYIIFYLIVAVCMFTLMFTTNAVQTEDTQAQYCIVTFFMYSGICAIVFGLISTPIIMLNHCMLPEENQIKLYIVKNIKSFKVK